MCCCVVVTLLYRLLEYLKQVAGRLNIADILTGHNANHLASLTFTLIGLGLGQDVLSLMVVIEKAKRCIAYYYVAIEI